MKTKSMSKMDGHQKAAYVTLCDAADAVAQIITHARSSDHALSLSEATIVEIRNAVLALHAAQREME